MRIVSLDETSAPQLDPDIVWTGLTGDLAMTPLTDPANPGGLQSGEALKTAVLICLMTDCRVDPTELRDGDMNRGWPGDGFDLQPGETALGSKLWLLRRSALTSDIEVLAEDYAQQALQTLIDQGAFVRFDVSATVDRTRNRLDLDVEGFGRDGASRFHQKFAVLWDGVS